MSHTRLVLPLAAPVLALILVACGSVAPSAIPSEPAETRQPASPAVSMPPAPASPSPRPTASAPVEPSVPPSPSEPAGSPRPSASAPSSGGPAGDAALVGGWSLVRMNGDAVPSDAGMNIGFEPGGGVGGSAGCNTFGGTYLVDGDTVRFADLTSTLMGCEEDILERESAFHAALALVETWSVNGGELVLADGDGEELLAFVPLEPTGITGTAWSLVELAGAPVPVDAGITATFEDGGRISGSAGCNTYFGDYLLDGGSLTIGALGSTRMACGGDGVMEREAAFLDAMARVRTWALDGDRLALETSDGDRLVFQPSA